MALSDPWDEPALVDPWDQPEASVPMEFTGEELSDKTKPQSEMIGKHGVAAFDFAPTAADLIDQGKSAVVGALPPALGAAYDTARDIAGDIPRRLAGQEQFAKVQNLLDAYRAAKSRREGILAQSQSEHPIATLGGQMAGGAVLAAPALAALPAAAGSMSQIATASAVNRLAEKGDLASLPRDMMQDIGAAGLVKGGVDLAKEGVIAAAGRLAQAPQRITEWAADKLGGTRVGRLLAGDEVKPLPEGASPYITGLREQQMAGDVGVQAAREMSEAVNNVGGLAGQRIASLTPTEKQTVAEQMAQLFSKRGSTVSADDLVRNWDELAPRMFLRADKDSVADLLRSVNTRDEAYLAALGSNIAARARVVGKAGSQIDPVRQMLDASEASHNEFLVGKMTRGGQATAPGSSQGAFHVKPEDIPNPQSPQDQMALRLARAADRGEAKLGQVSRATPGQWKPGQSVEADMVFPRREFGSVAEMSERAANNALDKIRPDDARAGFDTEEKLNRAVLAAKESLEGKFDYGRIGTAHRRELDESLDSVMTKAREFQEMMEQARARAADFGRTKKMASEAGAALDRMAIGRQAMGNAVGVGAAMMGGGGIGGAGGAMLAAATGKPLGRGILRGIDTASAIGQKLQKVQPLVAKFAASDTPIGNAIRWALSADGETMLVRLAAVADLPGVD